mgnify:CR=1 FL=1
MSQATSVSSFASRSALMPCFVTSSPKTISVLIFPLLMPSAIFGNAHFGGRLIGELVESVRLAGLDGVSRDLSRDEMEFGYDRSRLQKTGEVVLSDVVARCLAPRSTDCGS